ncbi:MAG: hypothetical protein JST60_11340 [Chloroflexi bacterium SZAS-1]|mgnify:CR=1 FL=1|jgi:hypothetical protein|nr:hypothetical protein [Chloroflexi bacterium SZAS-1]HNP87322.1 hypothetical protein [Kouleothrix sp.]
MVNNPIIVGMNARLFPNNWRPVRDEIAFAAQRFSKLAGCPNRAATTAILTQR